LDGRGNDVVRSSKGRDTLNGGIDTDRLADKAGRRGDRHFGKVQDTLNAKDGRRSDLLSDGARRDKDLNNRGDRARSI
jgi:hypothetical protein